MGWHLGDEKEIFTLDEMIEHFSFDKISLGGPVFDLVKLAWVNNQHMKLKDLSELTDLAIPFIKQQGYDVNKFSRDKLEKMVKITREGSSTLKILAQNLDVYFEDDFKFPKLTEEMNSKDRKNVQKLIDTIKSEEVSRVLDLFKEKLVLLNDETDEEKIKEMLHTLPEILNLPMGKVFMPIRIALTGKLKGPDLYSIISIIGIDKTLERIENIHKR